jgi:hypothetical protein
MKLSRENCNFNPDSVQDFWNEFENIVVAIVDYIVPMSKEGSVGEKIVLPLYI